MPGVGCLERAAWGRAPAPAPRSRGCAAHSGCCAAQGARGGCSPAPSPSAAADSTPPFPPPSPLQASGAAVGARLCGQRARDGDAAQGGRQSGLQLQRARRLARARLQRRAHGRVPPRGQRGADRRGAPPCSHHCPLHARRPGAALAAAGMCSPAARGGLAPARGGPLPALRGRAQAPGRRGARAGACRGPSPIPPTSLCVWALRWRRAASSTSVRRRPSCPASTQAAACSSARWGCPARSGHEPTTRTS